MSNHELTQSTSQSKTNYSKTFAETKTNTNFSKKEQAILINTINEILQVKYIKAFSKIIPPKYIAFASLISNNCFCVYFIVKYFVDTIVQNYSFIPLNEHQITFRHLIDTAKRIILWNAHPTISHVSINEYLLLVDIKTLHQTTFFEAHFQDELARISNFRRQVYEHSDDILNVPSSLVVKYDNSDLRIFQTDDTLTCYTCKQIGHT